jgi:hypothetical protein
MITKNELAERIMETELEKIPEKEEVYEKHIFMDDNKVLIVGYDREESFCEEDPQEECGITYFWYWELRDSDNWDIIGENKDKDFTFCIDSEKDIWADDGDYSGEGSLSLTQMCTWSDQSHIEDIAEDVASEVLEWLE